MRVGAKRLLRITGVTLGVILGLLLLLILVLQWRTDPIAQRLIDGANEQFPGEFELENAELNLLRYLPNISLELSGVEFRESKDDPDSRILAVERMLVALNPFKLISNELKLTALELDSGFINIVQYRDSTSNISRALGTLNRSDSVEEEAVGESQSSGPLDLEITNLIISNVRFQARDELSGYSLTSTLETLTDQLVYNEDVIDNNLDLSLFLNELRDSTQVRLAEQRVTLNTELFLDRSTRIARFEECTLSLNGAGINLTGTYDIANQGEADLTFKSQNAHASLFSMLTNQLLLLPEDRVTLDGKINLDGVVKGKTLSGQRPFMQFDLATESITLYDKVSAEYLLRDMDCRVAFTTGTQQDYSELDLTLDTLNVEFPNGFIRGSGAVQNLTKPRVKLRLLADNNMASIQKLLNPENIDGLTGRIKTDIDINIKLDPESGKYDRDFGTSEIRWVNGAFNLPAQELRADVINVALVTESNSFEIESFDLVRGSSDFSLSGRLDDAISYLLRDPNDLSGELNLETSKLRLNDFIDSTLIPGISPEFYNLKTRITLTAPYEARQAGKRLLSGAVLSLARFETESNIGAPIKNLTGEVRADNRQLRLDNWLGILGESDVGFNLRLSSEKNLFNKYIKLYDLRLDYEFGSSKLRAADFFTFMDQFYLPDSYRDEVLSGFKLDGYIVAERPDSIEYARIPDLHFVVNDMRFELTSYPVPLTDFRFDLWKNERNAELVSLQGRIGNSDLKVSGELMNVFIPPNESARTLTGRLSIESNSLSTGDFMDLSDVLDFTPELYDLDTEFRLYIPAEVRQRSSGGLAGSYLQLINFDTKSNFISEIKKISGKIAFEERAVLLENWQGRLGESDVVLNIGLNGLPHALTERQEPRDLTLSYDVTSERIRAADLFTFRDSFYYLEQFEEEEMKDLRFAGEVSVRGKVGDPNAELNFNINELEWDLVKFPIAFRDFKVDMTMRPGESYLNTFRGKIGRSNFELTGRAANLSSMAGIGSEQPELELTIVSNRLDLNELMDLYLPTLEQAAATESSHRDSSSTTPHPLPATDSTSAEDFNVFLLPIPEGQMTLRIDTINFLQSNILNTNGTLAMSADRTITLETFEVAMAGGIASMSGVVDLTNPDSARLQLTAQIAEADFDQLTDSIIYGEEIYVPADHFSGVFNTRADITTRILPDLSLDVTNATGNISLSFADGEIVDFGPMQMLSDYMGSKDLANVRFDSLRNELELENGYIFIPKMDINSTLGAIRLTGFQYLNAEMEYMVQIPFSLVTSVGWNTMTGKERKEDAAPDEIVQMKDGGINVNIRIVGTVDDYDIKLGKGKTFKAIDKEEKKQEREARKKAKKENKGNN